MPALQVAPVSSLIQANHLQTAPLRGNLSAKAKPTLLAGRGMIQPAGLAGQELVPPSLREVSRAGLGKMGSWAQPRLSGKFVVIRQVWAHSTDISQWFGLAQWGEVSGQGCGELEVSTPVTGTDGPRLGWNEVLDYSQGWGSLVGTG